MVPGWLAGVVGTLVIIFGLFRLWLGFRPAQEAEAVRRRGGLFAYGRRTQVLFGAVYILMGVMLLLGAFGLRLPWQLHR